MVESEIKRVSKLINNLLKFSKEETLVPEHVDLDEIFNEVIGLFDPKAKAEPVDKIYDGYNMIPEAADLFKITFKEKHIDFYLSAKLKDEELVCGRDSLKQVLFNLIKNAFESCDEHDGIMSTGIERSAEGV